MQNKICSVCKENKLLDAFYKCPNSKFGRRSICKICDVTRSTAYYLKDAKDNPNKYKNKNLKSKYKITLDEYNNLFLLQNGCCKICNLHQLKFKRKLAVDHNHKTGEVRGLLCHNCNLAIGLLYENEDIINNVLLYLRAKPKLK